ncbi:MAG: hypothetical protein ACLTMP_13770 [Eggerthella lenta]
MFSTSTAKRVAREAEKIVSLKEDMDAVSWTRVLEIGNQLQEGVDEAERVSLARELVSIAQSNRSLYTRLGLDPEPSSSRVMASGIEVMEGGLAEAAIEKRGSRAAPPIVEAPSIEPEVFVEEPSEADFQGRRAGRVRSRGEERSRRKRLHRGGRGRSARRFAVRSFARRSRTRRSCARCRACRAG